MLETNNGDRVASKTDGARNGNKSVDWQKSDCLFRSIAASRLDRVTYKSNNQLEKLMEKKN